MILWTPTNLLSERRIFNMAYFYTFSYDLHHKIFIHLKVLSWINLYELLLSRFVPLTFNLSWGPSFRCLTALPSSLSLTLQLRFSAPSRCLSFYKYNPCKSVLIGCHSFPIDLLLWYWTKDARIFSLDFFASTILLIK